MLKNLILGTAQFGSNYGINNNQGLLPKSKIFSILDYAYDNNLNKLDTAESYGNFYNLFREYNYLNPSKHFKVFSKLDVQNLLKKNNLEEHVIHSLNFLGIKNFEGYMIHDYKVLIDSPGLYNRLLNLKEKGLTKKIGISTYNNSQIKNILENFDKFDFIQSPFNLLDNENKRGEVYRLSNRKGINIYARSVFLQGLFFKPSKKIPKKLRSIIPYIKILNEISLSSKSDLEAIALKYVSKKRFIKNFIIGIDNLNQLKRNLKILNSNIQIPEDKIDKISVKNQLLLNPTNWFN